MKNKPNITLIIGILLILIAGSCFAYYIYKDKVINEDYYSLQTEINTDMKAYDGMIKKALSEENKDSYEEVNPNTFLSQNSDVVAFIYIPDTEIKYPVLQTDNNDYYLHNDFWGKKLDTGAIFLDCDTDITDDNLVVYGHNYHLSDPPVMFSTFPKFYYDEEYVKEHSMITFNTLESKRTYQIVSVAKYNLKHGAFDFVKTNYSSATEKKNYLKDVVSNSCVSLNVPDIEDKALSYLTLVTCDRKNYGRMGRCIITAVLVDESPYENEN